METDHVDFLIARYQRLGEKAEKIRKKRAAIADMLPQGRTPGTELAFYKEPAKSDRFGIDMEKLKRLVHKNILDQCRVCKGTRRGGVRIVKNLQPRKKAAKAPAGVQP